MRTRIFLVDDEQPVLDGLTVTIDKRLKDLEICGTARSGKAAVEGISREKPDIVIMDVRMPGMSGLDALRELRRLSVDCITILLTAYERFDIAKEAFSLGVYDYLVKPVEQEVLTETLEGALNRLEELRLSALRATDAREELELAKPLLEAGFIYSIILGSPDSSHIETYGHSLSPGPLSTQAGTSPSLFHFAVIDVAGMDLEEVTEIRRDLTYRLPCVVGPDLGGLLPLFVTGDRREETAAVLVDCQGGTLHFAVGSCTTLVEARTSWSEALQGLSAPRGSAASSGRFAEGEAESDLGQMEEAARVGDLATAETAFSRWVQAAPGTPAAERAIVAGAMALAAGAPLTDALRAGKEQLAEPPQPTQTLPERSAKILSAALAVGRRRRAPGDADSLDRRVQIALRFIDEHYTQPISLEDAAERAELSPAHLSRLLAAETGAAFTDHLTARRIGKAKKELSGGLASVKEIALLCGYQDANYFSRVFKKATGETPSEYAHAHGRSII